MNFKKWFFKKINFDFLLFCFFMKFGKLEILNFCYFAFLRNLENWKKLKIKSYIVFILNLEIVQKTLPCLIQ